MKILFGVQKQETTIEHCAVRVWKSVVELMVCKLNLTADTYTLLRVYDKFVAVAYFFRNRKVT